jgi:hypothetical protein
MATEKQLNLIDHIYSMNKSLKEGDDAETKTTGKTGTKPQKGETQSLKKVLLV